jgi:hypothetical protein
VRGIKMKAIHSRDYYLDKWDEFIKPCNDRDYMNLESELDREIRTFDDADLPDEALDIIRRMKAQEIIAKADKAVRERMQTIMDLECGRSSLGYRTEMQEVAARATLRRRWEFNCLQLSIFKQNHKEVEK